MAHIDALKMYFDLRKSGFTDEQAEAQAKSADNAISQALSEFASNKLITIFGTIIIAIGGFSLTQMWNLSHDMTEVKSRLASVEHRVTSIEDKLDRR